MSDPVIRRVRRSIDEAKNRGGMQAGMPKVTIDAGDVERLCIVAEALATTQAENEALRARVAELSEALQVAVDTPELGGGTWYDMAIAYSGPS